MEMVIAPIPIVYEFRNLFVLREYVLINWNKGVLAIRRVFSLVSHYDKHEFSNCSNT